MELKQEVQELINNHLNTMKSLAIKAKVSVPTLMKAQRGELGNEKTLNHLKVMLK